MIIESSIIIYILCKNKINIFVYAQIFYFWNIFKFYLDGMRKEYLKIRMKFNSKFIFIILLQQKENHINLFITFKIIK